MNITIHWPRLTWRGAFTGLALVWAASFCWSLAAVTVEKFAWRGVPDPAVICAPRLKLEAL